mgnify:CR=1 FL=1
MVIDLMLLILQIIKRELFLYTNKYMTRDVLAIKSRLTEKGLKVTPQRIAVLEAIYSLNNHPTVDNITEFIRKDQPNIAVGTVYKVLDTLVENGIVKRVKTESDLMRYDGILEQHHHLYCAVSEDRKSTRLNSSHVS